MKQITTKINFILSLLLVTFVVGCGDDETPIDANAPAIHSMSPEQAYTNDIVILIGNNFSDVNENNIVRFGEHVAKVRSSSKEKLEVVVPQGSGEVAVTVTVNELRSESILFQFLVPELNLLAITPDSGLAGDIITLTGDNFNENPFNNLVQFDDVVAEVAEASKTELKVIVPEGKNIANVTVSVGRKKTGSKQFTYSVANTTVSALVPSTGFAGDEIVIEGTFKIPFELNEVTFGSVVAEVLESSTYSLKVKVPVGTADVPVVVTYNGQEESVPRTFSYAGIKIDKIEPKNAQARDVVTISGNGFNPSATNNTVLFGQNSGEVLEATSSQLKVRVPSFQDDNADVFVTVNVSGTLSNSLDFHLLRYYMETIAGSGVKGSSTSPVDAMSADMNQPVNLTFDKTGTLYIAESGGATVRKLTTNRKIEFIAGKHNTTGSADGNGDAATFKYPYDVAVDNSGNIYVADVTNQLIRKITPGGNVTTIAGQVGSTTAKDGKGANGTFTQPYGLTFDNQGNLLVADKFAIRRITLSDNTVSTVSGVNLNAAVPGALDSFNGASDLVVDKDDNIYVADRLNNCIKKITSTGVVSILAGPTDRSQIGNVDGPGPDARFFNPSGIAIAPNGDLFVSDGTSNKNYYIRRITADGYTTTVGGTGDPTTGYVEKGLASTVPFKGWGLTIDTEGVIYVPDQQYLRIRKVYLK